MNMHDAPFEPARLGLALLDQTRDAIVVHDGQQRICYWNHGAQRLFGYSADEALGRDVTEILGPGSALAIYAPSDLNETGCWQGELECKRQDGQRVQVERRCRVLPGAQGQPLYVLVDCDITERHRAEKEIVLLNNLLEQRIQSRTAALEERSEDLRGVAYSLAHDLRGPLAAIDGFSAQLERRLQGQLEDQDLHYLDRVRAGVQQMSLLTDGLLALTEVSRVSLQRDWVDLSALARAALQRLRTQEPWRAVRLLVRRTPLVQGDPVLLACAVDHLINNAWKFTANKEGARIVFGSQSMTEGGSCYYISDNGAGFDPDYSSKLFQPFQRLHSQNEFAGTGIGLAITRKIFLRHGGRIWADSQVQAGARFSFTVASTAESAST